MCALQLGKGLGATNVSNVFLLEDDVPPPQAGQCCMCTLSPRTAQTCVLGLCAPQLGKSLEAELKLAKISNVGIHNLSPGMVTTELLMSGANTSGAKFFINCLGESVTAKLLCALVQ